MRLNKIKYKIYKILFNLLLIFAIVLISMLTYKYISEYKNEEEIKRNVEIFNNNDSLKDVTTTKENLKYKGYNVIGKIKITKINIEYPILEIENINPETAKKPMKISIIKYWGKSVNDYGNLSLAGHNNKSGTMFGKIKQLNKGDIIELTDLEGKTIKYSIYNIFVTTPDDVNILLTENELVREVTLITCINGNKERLILKAQAIE